MSAVGHTANLKRAHRAAELADAIESAYGKRPAGKGTKIQIEQSDWPLMVEALRLCASLLEFEAKNDPAAVIDGGNNGR